MDVRRQAAAGLLLYLKETIEKSVVVGLKTYLNQEIGIGDFHSIVPQMQLVVISRHAGLLFFHFLFRFVVLFIFDTKFVKLL